MTVQFTEEQLNSFDKATLISLFLQQQEQLKSIDDKLQLVLEQMSDMNRRRFGTSSEKYMPENQLAFSFEDGDFCIFNEAEAIACETEEEETETTTVRAKRPKGKREADISGLPIEVFTHEMSEDELQD